MTMEFEPVRELKPVGNPETKRSIIPKEWKQNIDALLAAELLGANRSFAAHSKTVAQVKKVERQLPPEQFIQELHDRWNWHNTFYEDLLEPALPDLLTEHANEMSPEHVVYLREAYKASSLVDLATICVSASIKDHIHFWTSSEQMGPRTEREQYFLLTPPHESFWTKYYIDHLEYILAIKGSSNGAEALKGELLRNYHISDDQIFRGRMKRFDSYLRMSQGDVQKEIEELRIKEQYKVEHFYSTLESPRRRAIRDILEFDNIVEYKVLCNLIGIAGFLLRKALLRYLNEEGIEKNDGGIYSLDDETILKSLSEFERRRTTSFRKPMWHFRQTTGETCVPVCCMMINAALEHRRPDRKAEHLLYEKFRSHVIPGCHFSAVGFYYLQRGYEGGLFHEEQGLFKNEGLLSPEVFSQALDEYKTHFQNFGELGGRSETGVRIDFSFIKSLLEKDFFVMIGGQVQDQLHAVIASGYGDDKLVIQDPLERKEVQWSEDRLKQYLASKIGSWIMVVRKKKDPVKRLMIGASKYQEEARQFLSRKGVSI